MSAIITQLTFDSCIIIHLRLSRSSPVESYKNIYIRLLTFSFKEAGQVHVKEL